MNFVWPSLILQQITLADLKLAEQKRVNAMVKIDLIKNFYEVFTRYLEQLIMLAYHNNTDIY